MRRPKASETVWDYFHNEHTPDYSYRVMMSREHTTDYFRLNYYDKNKQHKIKYFYGETAWMDITRFIHDLGDWSFSIDNILDDMVNSFVDTLADSKGC